MFYAIKINVMTIISLPLMPQKKKRKNSFDPSGNEHESSGGCPVVSGTRLWQQILWVLWISGCSLL